MSSSVSQAQVWAAQRRAAIAKAEALRKERQREEQLVGNAELPFDPSDRHLPNCKCNHCMAGKHVQTEIPSVSGGLISGGWNNDFADGCKDGFDALLRDQTKAKRHAALKKKEQSARVRGASADRSFSKDLGMKRNRSVPGLRALAAPSAKADEGPSTRINFDKRTSRHMHALSFRTAISKFRGEVQFVPAELLFDKVKFFVRKRPLFEHECARGEYDVITCRRSWAVVHVCGMAPDLQRMHIVHNHFPCAEAFDENSTNDELESTAMAPLITHAIEGGMSTCLMYGATGSGKTYTMTAMQERAASALCAKGVVTLTMLELAGKDVRDLLAPEGVRVVTLRENGAGQLDLGGAFVSNCADGGQLIASLKNGQERRKTCTTLANATSSRSHLVCLLGLGSGGSLVLVDCAGSERREDSSRHTTERQREGADINSSLLALKECIRALVSGASHVPYRMNTLTRVLRDSFTRPGAQFHVVATVAPGCSDAEHSVATLRTACSLCECGDQVREHKESIQPVTKTSADSIPNRIQSTQKNYYVPCDGSAVCEAQSNRTSIVPGNEVSNCSSIESHPCSETLASHGLPTSKPHSLVSCLEAPNKSDQSSNVPCTLHTNKKTSVKPCASVGPAANATKLSSLYGRGSNSKHIPANCDSDRRKSPASIPISHPSKWSMDDLEKWLQRQTIGAILPPSADGRVAVRWNLKRWTELCGGDERVGLRAFNGLRLEMDRLAEEEKLRRKQFMSGR